MSEDDSKRFHFSLDEEEPARQQPEKMDSVVAPATNRRNAMLAVLVPCLLLLVILFAYADLKKRVDAIQNTGQTSVQNLSSDFESRLSALSIQTAKLKDVIATESSDIKKEMESLSAKLSTETAARKKADAVFADKKTVEKADNALEKKFAPLKKEIQDLSPAVKDVDAKVSRELAVFSQKFSVLNRELETVKTQAKKWEANIVDKQVMDKALLQQYDRLKNELETTLAEIDRQLKDVQQELKRITTRTAHHVPAAPKSLPEKPSKSPKAEKTSQPAGAPGGIIEQELVE